MSTSLRVSADNGEVATLEPISGAYLYDAIARALEWMEHNGQEWCYLRFNGTSLPVCRDPARSAGLLFQFLRGESE